MSFLHRYKAACFCSFRQKEKQKLQQHCVEPDSILLALIYCWPVKPKKLAIKGSS